jgi:hypothetical protein
MHGFQTLWVYGPVLLCAVSGALLHFRGKSEAELKLQKAVLDGLLAMWTLGSVLALAPRSGAQSFDVKHALQSLPMWLSLLLIVVLLVLVAAKIVIAANEFSLARRQVRRRTDMIRAAPSVR